MVFVNSSVCWLPDGKTTGSDIDKPAIPCDPSAPVSACCSNTGVSCLNKGLCLGLNGGLYRGGCTDKTFKAAECGNPDPYCVGSEYASDYRILVRCDDGSYGCSSSDCNTANAFTLPEIFVQQVNITGLLASPSASASSSPTPSSNSSTSCPATEQNGASNSCKDTSRVAIGAGVGVPLGVLLLIAIATALWYRRKWRHATKGSDSSSQPVAAYHEYGQGGAEAISKAGHRSELSEQGMAELHSRPALHELDQR